jgi:uncharacterized protein YndB with AHSA1/START domain
MPVREIDSNTDSLTFEATVSATPDVVFSYFVTPELLAAWWAPAAEIDAHAGGQYVLSWPSQGWHLRGEYTDFAAGERLAFSWRWDHEPQLPPRLVSVQFEDAPPGALLRLIHGVYGQDAVEQADRQSHREGWLHFLGRLEEALLRT